MVYNGLATHTSRCAYKNLISYLNPRVIDCNHLVHSSIRPSVRSPKKYFRFIFIRNLYTEWLQIWSENNSNEFCQVFSVYQYLEFSIRLLNLKLFSSSLISPLILNRMASHLVSSVTMISRNVFVFSDLSGTYLLISDTLNYKLGYNMLGTTTREICLQF